MRARLVCSVLAAMAVGVVAGAPTASAADPPGTLLDALTPIAMASSGGDVAWLRPTDTPQPVLVVRRANGTVFTVDAPMPAGANELTLGTDVTGALTAVVAAQPDPQAAGYALYRVNAAPDAVPLELPVSGVDGAEYAPGLRAGRLTFVRATDPTHSSVQVGTLVSAASKTVANSVSSVIDTAPALGSRVAVTSLTYGKGTTTSKVRVLGAGKSALVLGTFATDTAGGDVGGIGPLTVDRSGTVVSFSRPGNGKGTKSGTGGGRAYWRYSVRSGARISQAKMPGDRDLVAPLVGGGYAGYDTDRLAGTPTGFVDAAHRCAPVGPRDCALYLLR